jgi:hypothetical protein
MNANASADCVHCCAEAELEQYLGLNFCFAPDVVEKLVDIFGAPPTARVRSSGSALLFALKARFPLFSDRLGFDRHRQSDQPPQVLRDGGHVEFVARSAETAKPHSFETKRGLQMRKQHLDLLPFVT